MTPKEDFKPTRLDCLTSDHHFQMMKAALPYMSVPQQKMLSMFVKIGELNKTMELFEDEEVAAMGICSLEERSATPLDMLNAMKPYGNSKDQDFIDLVTNFMQSSRLYRSYQEAPDSSQQNSGPFNGFPFSMEQLINFLPAEQQTRMETMQMMIQTMQQFT